MPAIRLSRPPKNDDELWLCIKALWGVELPRHRVCDGHVSPFEAVSHAYFSKDPNFAVWYASRGSGKSLALAVLGLTKTFVADADCTILGGSIWQSQNVREHMSKMLRWPNAPTYAVKRDITTMIETTTRKQIKPLPASQTSVRGPHPPLQLLDEIDEMDYTLYQAALGQAMEQLNTRGEIVGEYIVASSTWQNPVGCQVVNTPITTYRGIVPIQDVQVGDLVPTRAGWRYVTHVHDMGMQECVTVRFASGRELTCTPWHPVWVSGSGFVRADALSAGTPVLAHVSAPGIGLVVIDPALPAASVDAGSRVLDDDGARGSQIVPVIADGPLIPAELGRAGVVLLDRDGLEVPRIDAGTVRTSPAAGATGVPVVAEMVDVDVLGQSAVQLLPDPLVGRDDALGIAPVGLDPVAVLHDSERPRDALIGIEVDGYTFAEDKVVHVSHHGMVLPTWDLTVAGEPEYVANGILVHNTMTTVIDDARKKGLPVFTWCWRELIKSPANPHGWMNQSFIDRKKRTVSAEMWRTEYDLNEPSGTSRAFDLNAIEQYFVDYPEPIFEEHLQGGIDDTWVWEAPTVTGSYAAGADWAKEQDKTVLAVMRTDVMPRRLVALRRMNRQKYPVMTAAFSKWVKEYHATAQHDKTGVGNALNDFLDDDAAKGFVMVGRARAQMFTNYISDFEHGGYSLPRVEAFYRGHRGATVADVFAPHKWDEHTPDDVVAMAMAHRAAGKAPIPGNGELVGVKNDPSFRKVDAPWNPASNEPRPEGLVTVLDERYDDPFLVGMIGPGAAEPIGGWL